MYTIYIYIYNIIYDHQPTAFLSTGEYYWVHNSHWVKMPPSTGVGNRCLKSYPSGVYDLYPLVICKIATENCHLVRWFSHDKWWFSSSPTVNVYQRVHTCTLGRKRADIRCSLNIPRSCWGSDLTLKNAPSFGNGSCEAEKKTQRDDHCGPTETNRTTNREMLGELHAITHKKTCSSSSQLETWAVPLTVSICFTVSHVVFPRILCFLTVSPRFHRKKIAKLLPFTGSFFSIGF